MELISQEREERDIRTPYGKACTSCSRAKYKCIYRADRASCERCHRLKKTCQPSTSVRKRNLKKPSSQRAYLEERLNNLATVLQSHVTSTNVQPDAPVADYLDADSNFEKHPLNDDDPATTSTNARLGPHTPAATAPHSSASLSPFPMVDEVPGYGIPDCVAEEQLNKFRQVFLPMFPFVHIPVETSASELHRQKPFLWLVIMSLTTKSAADQLAMGEMIRQSVSQKVVAKGDKSLDMLLGLICYLGWFQIHKKEGGHLIMWAQLAVALVFELGIDKVPRAESDKRQVPARVYGYSPRQQASQARTMEERRAILGVYIITSMLWTGIRQMEPLRWTPYMDDCVRILTDKRETETKLDILLVTQVKCHQITDQLTYSYAEKTQGDGTKVPPAYFVKAMLQQLQDIRGSLPVELQSNSVVQLYTYSAEMIVREASVKRPKLQDENGVVDLQRLEELDSLLTTVERWLEARSKISAFDSLGITFTISSQLAHSVIVLFRLSTLDEPGWDKQEVRKRADLYDVLERTAQAYESLIRVHGMVDDTGTSESGMLFKAPLLIRGMKANFRAEMAPESDASASSGDQSVGPFGEPLLMDDTMIYLPDDPLFTELMYFHDF